jgi:hypothetical protein
VCKTWTTPKDLGGVVSRGIASLIKSRPAVGWVRADLVPDETAASEILRLRNKNDALRSQLERSKTQPPPGTEILASGDEKTDLHFSYEYQREWPKEKCSFTWNELFSILAPLMIDGAEDHKLKNHLGSFYTHRKLDLDKIDISNAYVRDEDFQKVKVQFRALGLIAKDERRPRETYWILTPYGDQLMTQIAAARSIRIGSKEDGAVA